MPGNARCERRRYAERRKLLPMRANSSILRLVVVVLVLAGGCARDDEAAVVAIPPELPEPAPAPAPATLDDLLRNVDITQSAQSQAQLDEIRDTRSGPSNQGIRRANDAFIPPTPPRRWFFQCDDNVTFAVRSEGGRLEVFPPGHSTGFIALTEVESDSGVHYTARDADFRMNGDLATLQIGRERNVDCVSNPAAAVWQEPPRRGMTAR
jgi:hypothetical protein